MKEDIKAQWVAALRSGEYTQGKTSLRTLNNKYCCLGVLCDLAVKAGATNEVEARNTDGSFVGWMYGPSTDNRWGAPGMESGMLPLDVQKWAGLETSSPHIPTNGMTGRSLVGLNDDVGLSFEEIADQIEAHL